VVGFLPTRTSVAAGSCPSGKAKGGAGGGDEVLIVTDMGEVESERKCCEEILAFAASIIRTLADFETESGQVGFRELCFKLCRIYAVCVCTRII